MSLLENIDRNRSAHAVQTVFGAGDYGAFTVVGQERDKVRIAVLSEGAEPVLRVRTAQQGQTFPKVQAQLRIDEDLPRGTVFLARFSMRAVESLLESGEVSVQFEVENTDNFALSTQFAAFAASQWQEFLVPFRLVCDAKAGVAAINFRVGSVVQELELREICVERFEFGTLLSDLPSTSVRPNYEGMEAAAPWRAAAAARSREHRMAPLRVTVASAEDTGAKFEIRIEQKRHAYWFGSAVQAGLLGGKGYKEEYAQLVKRFFNALVFENDMKWRQWLEDSSRAIEGARWCAQNDIALRGHTLVWPSFAKMPDALRDELAADPQKLREAVRERITDITTATAQWTDAWDVVNEPFRHNDLMQILGDGEMAEWFRLAQLGAPQSRLFLNDYGIVTGGGMDEQHQGHYEKTARSLLAAGAPLHGLGFQGHFGRILTPPERMLSVIDRFAALGLEIQMTEFSTHLEDGELAADYLRDALTVFFSHPATTAFMLWGFSDREDFPHGSLLLATDGSLTACGRAWESLIYKQWWTSERLSADAAGRAEADVFHGTHELTLLRDGEPLCSQWVEVGAGGADFTFNLAADNPMGSEAGTT